MRRDPLAHPEGLIRAVYAYVAYRVGPGPDAEDITSEVFERALRYRDSYDPKRGEPMAWLIGIARRSVNGLAPILTVRWTPSKIARPPATSPTMPPRRSLATLCRLSDRDRELIALRYGADLTGRQIGAMFDMSANAVDVAVHRAVERLRQALDGQVNRGQPVLVLAVVGARPFRVAVREMGGHCVHAHADRVGVLGVPRRDVTDQHFLLVLVVRRPTVVGHGPSVSP